MRTFILSGIVATTMLFSSLSEAQTPVFVNNAPTTGVTTRAVRSFSKTEISKELRNTISVVPLKPEGSVLRIIHRYIYENRTHTEGIIGRAYLYFPMIERLAAEYDVPEELKYLAVIESALKPVAKSYVGARGIWQFMPATGREYGLAINDVIDERLDPEKSTVAAFKYLKNANNRFKSWTLSLAAYNSGGGRVNRAVRRAHSKNFWKLKRFLPKETRSYVPAFIAASYVMNHYDEFGLVPILPSRDLYMKSKIKLNEGITFQKLGNLIGVEASILAELNPAFFAGYVPAQYEFYIPESAYSYVQTAFTLQSSIRPTVVNSSLLKQTHYVSTDETIWQIAQKYHCTPQAIMEWNGLNSFSLSENTALIIYKAEASVAGNAPVYSLPQNRKGSVKVLDKLPTLPGKAEIQLANNSEAINRISATRMRRTKIKKYTIRKTTSLNAMANWLDVDLSVLIQLNKSLVKSNRLSPGTIINVPGN